MVDNKVKTKTAMLQELESIKHLLLEEDDIPILQEVIDGQLAARTDNNQPPLEQQELDELQNQFQALSHTFSATTAAAAPAIVTHNQEPTTKSFAHSTNSDEFSTDSLEPLLNSLEPPTNSPERPIDSLELPINSLERPTNSPERPINSPEPTLPVQQALPMEVAEADAHSESDHSFRPTAAATDNNTMPSAVQTTENSADEPLVTNSPAKTQPARPTLAKASGENPFLPQHIRARLHGNNPPPLFDFMLNNNSVPSPAAINPASSSDKHSLHQNLVKEVVDALMPQLEDELRQRLKELTQEELERLRDQP
jgi:hypothetical protein